MRFLDNSQPPMIKTYELIAETLVQILKGEPKEKVPAQLEEQQSSHSGPVCVRGFPKVSNQPRSERLG
ncbi:hypothetical protein CesoFtcFv8_022470 [Champsocephalus esox]|uniref:Uncharacterized protein n=1 Tax=Champsocephalus esox TaxID=159716 RepID=A0AAN8BBM5_9TELE|nr:hypothetical protein CesoFtcFv8_022470 [Champsocephalus esox]